MSNDLSMSFFKDAESKRNDISEINPQLERKRQLISKEVSASLEWIFKLNK